MKDQRVNGLGLVGRKVSRACAQLFSGGVKSAVEQSHGTMCTKCRRSEGLAFAFLPHVRRVCDCSPSRFQGFWFCSCRSSSVILDLTYFLPLGLIFFIYKMKNGGEELF